MIQNDDGPLFIKTELELIIISKLIRNRFLSELEQLGIFKKEN